MITWAARSMSKRLVAKLASFNQFTATHLRLSNLNSGHAPLIY